MELTLLLVLLSVPSLAWTGVCPDGALPIIGCITNECPGGYQCIEGSCCRTPTPSATDKPPSRDSPSDSPAALRHLDSDYGSEKPGSCPASPKHGTALTVTPCQNDFHCQGDWKCCPTASGSICVDINEPRSDSPGVLTKQRRIELMMCVVDEECVPPLKCVNSRRGRICAIAVTEKPVCPRNEEFAQCASTCQTGCLKDEPDATCKDTYCRPGCICRSGFIRLRHNDWRSRCIPMNKCVEVLKSNYLDIDEQVFLRAKREGGSFLAPPDAGGLHVPESGKLAVRCETSLHCSSGHVCHRGTCVPGRHETKDPSDCPDSKRRSGCATKDECSTDFDCPKGAECARSAKGRECRFTRVITASNGAVGEAALCPNGRQPSSRCTANECPSDHTCWKGICCPLGNVKVTSKSSGCPPIRSLSASPKGQVHFCDSDPDCFPNESCCPTATGRQCMNTQIISSSVAAVSHRCSDGSRSVQVCYSDLECRDGMLCENGLCCSQKRERPGQCPEMFYQPTDAKPRDHCSSDDECSDPRRKCCPTLLGKRCLFHTGVTEIHTIEEHVCFDGSRPAGPCRLNACPSGFSCEAGYCCQRRRSYDAVTHTSLCPPLSFMRNLASFPSCISGSDCVNGTICCPAVSGSKCVHPETNKRSQESSDSCEAGSRPLGLIPLRCEGDSSCPSGTKCCNFKGTKLCTGQ